jgi:hypothetical protein
MGADRDMADRVNRPHLVKPGAALICNIKTFAAKHTLCHGIPLLAAPSNRQLRFERERIFRASMFQRRVNHALK